MKQTNKDGWGNEVGDNIAQQPLSGSADASPKSAEPTSENGKRCTKSLKGGKMNYLDYIIKFEKETGMEIQDYMPENEQINFHHKFSVWLISLLEQPANRNVGTPTSPPKFPSLEDVKKVLWSYYTYRDKNIDLIYDTIKKLGNFA